MKAPAAGEQSLFNADPTTFDLFKQEKREFQYQDKLVKPWDEGKAYDHTVVMGNDGLVINRLVVNNGPADTVDDIVVAKPAAWFSGRGGEEMNIVLYAHGGLNSEGASIRRIRTMAPYFEANGIYPVFFTWRTGLLESIVAIMDDAVNRLFPHYKGIEDVLAEAQERASDILDRTLEVASENLGVKAVWSQMKQNAEASAMKSGNNRGAYLTIKALARLQKKCPGLNIHLVGHSAGSILLGHMLRDCQRNKVRIASCTLYAAACSVDFANRHYIRAIEKNVLKKSDLHLHLLSDARERDDTVGPYRKSLLYLVSRALENLHKTPLLGMANVFDPSKNKDGKTWNSATVSQLKTWQKFWGKQALSIVNDEQVLTAAEWKKHKIIKEIAWIKAAHGAFDNDILVVDQTIERIIGKPLPHSVENLRY